MEMATKSPVIKRVEFYAALLITVLVVWLHLTRMKHAGGLWRDEAGAAQVALMPSVHELTKVFQHEAFPLLFPLTVRTYVAFAGASDTAFRVFGMLVGLGIIASLWINSKLLFEGVPLLSLALLGLNASVLQWGDSLRGYGMGIVLILITFGLVWRLVISPSIYLAISAALAAICSVQVLYYNAVLLFAIGAAGVAVAVRNRHWPRAFLLMGIGGIAALSLIPYVATLQRAKEWNLIITIPEFSFSFFWSKLSAALSSAGNGVCWLWVVLVIAVVAASVFVQFRYPSSRPDRKRDLGLYCLVVLLLSSPAYFYFLKILSYPTQPWYYVALMGLVAVALEGALVALPWQRWSNAGRILVAASVIIWSFVPAWNVMLRRQTNLDLLATKLKEVADARDVIVVSPWYFGVTFQRYYDGSAPWMTLPPIDDHKIHRYDLLKAQMATMNPIEPVLRTMGNALKSGNRVWLVGPLSFPPPGQTPIVLAPAPFDSVGWDQFAYSTSWSMQVGHFLKTHVLDARDVPVSDLAIDPYEHVQLIVVQGWRSEGQ